LAWRSRRLRSIIVLDFATKISVRQRECDRQFQAAAGLDRGLARLIQPAPITAKTNTSALAMTGGDAL
jgi:hypothetical protein